MSEIGLEGNLGDQNTIQDIGAYQDSWRDALVDSGECGPYSAQKRDVYRGSGSKTTT